MNINLSKIIFQGSKEYQELFNNIVRTHRQEFTEENWPTAEHALKTMLEIAIHTIAIEELKNS